ncbi:MAG: response regulator [Limnothrix sp. RL_2_0]|nr:response regulator [Limnothrix sp. RL_2_0]
MAEDNKINQKVIRQLLKRLGYEMDLAETGLEVLEYLKHDRCDVILMDLLMPDMGGLEATRTIHRTYPIGDRPGLLPSAPTQWINISKRPAKLAWMILSANPLN